MKEFDSIYEEYIGASGVWQWTIALTLCVAIFGAVMFPVFGNTIPMHRCRMENEIEEYLASEAYTQQFNFTFENVSSMIEGVTSSPSGCHRISQTWTKDTFIQQHLLFSNITGYSADKPKEICHRGYIYAYNEGQYSSSITESWDLVCNSAWLVPLTTSAYMLAMIPGMFLGSWLSDRYGRRLILITSGFLELSFGIGASFVPSYLMFIVLRCCIGALSATQIVVSTVLMVELTSSKHRGQFTSMWGLFVDCLQPLIAACMAYFVSHWRWLHFSLSLLKILCLTYPWLIPESPMWLISHGNPAKTVEVLRIGQRINNTPCFKQLSTNISTKELEHVINDINLTENSPQITEFKKPFRLFIATLVNCSILLMGIQASYFGVLFYATAIRGSIYVVVSINALAALPGTLISTLCYRYSPTRKIPLIVTSMFMISLFFSLGLYTILLKPTHEWALIVGGNIGFMLAGASLNMFYVYISELFPVRWRAKGLGFAIGLGRIGAVSSAFINQLDITLGHGYPMLIYAFVLLLVSCAFFRLREIWIGKVRADEVACS